MVPNPLVDLLVVDIRDLVDNDRFEGDDIKDDNSGSLSSSRQNDMNITILGGTVV